jgi:hypothetical protein
MSCADPQIGQRFLSSTFFFLSKGLQNKNVILKRRYNLSKYNVLVFSAKEHDT